MGNGIDYQEICNATIKLLQEHEWKQSYSKYLSNWAIFTKSATNYNQIKKLIRNGFYNANKGLSEGLYFEQNFGLYTSVSVESERYDLRFRGLSIADFHIDKKLGHVFDKPLIKKQKDGSNYTPKLVQLLGEKHSKDWATGEKNIPIEKWDELSRMFAPDNIPQDYYNEAVVESALLNHINKQSKENSPFSNITAITRPKEKTAYFQFNTPLSCSNIHNYYCQKGNQPITEFLKYSKPSYGGGIDILCRRGRGGSSILQVVEVKDSYLDNEQPQYAISQAIAYSTFLLRLLRSDEVSCEIDRALSWWKIIVGQRKKDSPLMIEAVVVMPPNPNGKTALDFIDKEVSVPWEDRSKHDDTIRLKYIPFIQGNVKEESFSFKYIR